MASGSEYEQRRQLRILGPCDEEIESELLRASCDLQRLEKPSIGEDHCTTTTYILTPFDSMDGKLMRKKNTINTIPVLKNVFQNAIGRPKLAHSPEVLRPDDRIRGTSSVAPQLRRPGLYC
ncbi:hypothetical protein PG996_004066 [Apiospora saccharicola]|uniref:Uncharacterized protein n=1 Tax=Apiospora saccharicola TaxID=335842 RepID=A0ABR1W316_9PEZI